MRTKFILTRSLPALIIIVTLFYLVDLKMFHDESFSTSLTLNHDRADKRYTLNAMIEPLQDAIDNFGNMFRHPAYSEEKVNRKKLYASLNLTTNNLERFAHLCESNLNDSLMLVGLMSRGSAFDRRDLIRKTFSKQIRVFNQKLLFFVAESLNDTINEQIEKEIFLNQDMIRLNFVEDYYNLTLKTIGFLEYFNSYCDRYKYAIKIDDDVILNVRGTLNYLTSQSNDTRPRLYCQVYESARVIRDISSKWYLNKKIYSSKYYPNYCAGPVYVLNREAVRRLIQEHQNKKKYIIAFEDVYTTGLLTQGTEIRLIKAINMLSYRWYDKRHLYRNYFNNSIMAIHPIVDRNYERLYSKIYEPKI